MVTAALLFCRTKKHSLVKYDIMSIFSIMSFNYLPTKTLAKPCKRAVPESLWKGLFKMLVSNENGCSSLINSIRVSNSVRYRNKL